MSNKTPFERSIQESLQGYEAPFDPSAWEGIEAGLGRMEQENKNRKSKGRKTAQWATGIAAAALIAGGAFFLADDGDEADGKSEKASEELSQQVAKEEAPSKEKEVSDKKEQKEPKKDGPRSSSKEEEAETSSSQENREDANEQGIGTQNQGHDEASDNEQGRKKKEADTEKETEDLPEWDEPQEKEVEEADQAEASIQDDLQIKARNRSGCPPLTTSFELEEERTGVDYFWDFGDGDYSNKADPTHRYEEAGNYDVTLTLTDRSSGRTFKVEEKGLVTVHSSPNGSISELPTDRAMRKPRPISIFELQESEGVEDIVWELGDGTRVEGSPRVEHRYASKGLYTVKTYLKGEEGCRDTLRYQYEKEKSYDLLAPNSFQPNGNGRNDHFIPEALKVLDRPFTMTIHDRSGRVVYKTKDASKPWNGRIQNSGSKVKDGSVFLWVVVLQNEQGEEETYKGHVTVIR